MTHLDTGDVSRNREVGGLSYRNECSRQEADSQNCDRDHKKTVTLCRGGDIDVCAAVFLSDKNIDLVYIS